MESITVFKLEIYNASLTDEIVHLQYDALIIFLSQYRNYGGRFDIGK